MIKRGFDIVISLIGLLFLSPILVIIAALIKVDDRGPILYCGERVGRHGKLFRVLKFRTMVADAERIGPPSTADDDPRITPIGGVLRKYKLDELPELINVLLGEMSLVGPRPEIKSEVDLYTDAERLLLTMRPGLTDYASIQFHDEGEILRGSADPHEAYRRLIRPRKLALGLHYVKEASFWIDLKILALTLATLISSRTHRNASPSQTSASQTRVTASVLRKIGHKTSAKSLLDPLSWPDESGNTPSI
jgi:lipopolysaccharide/colanic/teichoic acid biosynthesis glycosyltransferase